MDRDGTQNLDQKGCKPKQSSGENSIAADFPAADVAEERLDARRVGN